MFSFMALAQPVHTSGTARNVMLGIDLNATVQLDSLTTKPNLFALGPVDNLQGEITVLNGTVYTSAIANGKIVSSVQNKARAPFLAYAYVPEWQLYEMSVKITNQKSVEQLVDSIGEIHGYNDNDAFPFLLESTWQQIDFHIIMRDTTEEKHSHESHNKAKVKFHREKTAATLLGFFSRHHEGVFTHRGQFVHVHYLREDHKETGHLDEIQHFGNIKLYLPVRNF
jgi:acetolactate decarboxylase